MRRPLRWAAALVSLPALVFIAAACAWWDCCPHTDLDEDQR